MNLDEALAFEPYSNRPSEIARLLEMVDRGCIRLMKAGGGIIRKESLTAGRRMPKEVADEIARIVEAGGTSADAAAKTGYSASAVHRVIAKRGIATPEARALAAKKEAARKLLAAGMKPRQVWRESGLGIVAVYRLRKEMNK